eukprot:4813478-Prymnesium_polylepis.1
MPALHLLRIVAGRPLLQDDGSMPVPQKSPMPAATAATPQHSWRISSGVPAEYGGSPRTENDLDHFKAPASLNLESFPTMMLLLVYEPGVLCSPDMRMLPSVSSAIAVPSPVVV